MVKPLTRELLPAWEVRDKMIHLRASGRHMAIIDALSAELKPIMGGRAEVLFHALDFWIKHDPKARAIADRVEKAGPEG